jgi:hypothetical protein
MPSRSRPQRPPEEVQQSSRAPPRRKSACTRQMRRKAKRLARLLVDEIKLYNQSKQVEGRKSQDLYDRLKQDTDKRPL